MDRITKLMDGKSTIEESLGLKPNKDGVNVGVKELRQIYDEDPNLKKIIDIAIKVEGLPRNTSMHAAGVVICAKPIADNVPLQRNGEDITTQFNMKQVEQLGMLKMDFLGLITLTDIKKAVDYVKETTGRVLDFHELGYEDPGTYDLIGSGDTDAVFQLESPGMKRFMRDLRPTTFEDIIAGISLYRPGPMDSIPDYIKYKHNPQSIKYKHPLMEPILSNSYGVMIYQEQVMEVCRSLGGFSFGQADIVRRAMGKKNVEEMDRQKKIFVHGGVDDKGRTIDGAIVRGVPEAVAIDIFDEMAGFAKYGGVCRFGVSDGVFEKVLSQSVPRGDSEQPYHQDRGNHEISDVSAFAQYPRISARHQQEYRRFQMRRRGDPFRAGGHQERGRKHDKRHGGGTEEQRRFQKL